MRSTRRNLWPFKSSTKPRPTTTKSRRSSMTIGQAVRAARQAGERSGDTGLFDSWLESQGLSGRGDTLKRRLRAEYEQGFEQALQKDKSGAVPVASKEFTYKRHTIRPAMGGGWKIDGRFDDGSTFDSPKDARAFIDSWNRTNGKRMAKKSTGGGRPVLTRRLAWAAATDEANRQMRKAGREAWSEDDYNLAVQTFNRLWPEERDFQRNPAGLTHIDGVSVTFGSDGRAIWSDNWPRLFEMARAGEHGLHTVSGGPETYGDVQVYRQNPQRDIRQMSMQEVSRIRAGRIVTKIGNADKLQKQYGAPYIIEVVDSRGHRVGYTVPVSGGSMLRGTNPGPGDPVQQAYSLGFKAGEASAEHDVARSRFHRDYFRKWLPLQLHGHIDRVGRKRDLENSYDKGYAEGAGKRFNPAERSISLAGARRLVKPMGFKVRPSEEDEMEYAGYAISGPAVDGGARYYQEFSRTRKSEILEAARRLEARYAGKGRTNPAHSVLYYASFSDPDELRRALVRDGIEIEKERSKEFTAGAGGPLPQFTIKLPDGYRGYLVPRRGYPSGKMAGRVWYEWHGLGRNPNSKRNPADDSDAAFRSFHGADPTETVTVEEEIHEHEYLWTCGQLVDITIDTPTGLEVTLSFESDPPFLAASEDGTQLYIEGGDQAVDLKALKMDGDAWLKDRMVLGTFAPPHGARKWNLTYHARKDFDKFEPIDYQHDLGESSKGMKEPMRPLLEYDPRSQHLYISGGQYSIKRPLFGTSPGIEN